MSRGILDLGDIILMAVNAAHPQVMINVVILADPILDSTDSEKRTKRRIEIQHRTMSFVCFITIILMALSDANTITVAPDETQQMRLIAESKWSIHVFTINSFK
jgi:hypothetical protein